MMYVELNLEPLSRAFRMMSADMQRWVISDTLNRALDKAYTTAKRAVPQQAKIAQVDVTAGLVKKPTSRGHSVYLLGGKRHFPGGYKMFKARQGAKGTRISRWPDSGAMFVRGAFMAKMPSGHYSMFVRAGSYTTRRRRSTNSQRRVYNSKTGRTNSQLPIIDIGWGPAVAAEAKRLDKPARALIGQAITVGFQQRMKQNIRKSVSRAKAANGL